MEQKQADSVSIILMRPYNGEILAMVNVPEFNLNDPFTLQVDTAGMSAEEKQDALNQMWRNGCINDTYDRVLLLKSLRRQRGLRRAWCH